jgi:hypothetical protein
MADGAGGALRQNARAGLDDQGVDDRKRQSLAEKANEHYELQCEFGKSRHYWLLDRSIEYDPIDSWLRMTGSMVGV